jgi:hypothetical protein
LAFIEINDSEASIDPHDPEAEDTNNKNDNGSNKVRVIFAHRHVQYLSNRPDGCLDAFALEAVGHPFVQVLPSSMPTEELYELVHRRFSHLLKGAVESIQAADEAVPAERAPEVVTEILGPSLRAAEGDNQVLLAGRVPSYGFVLRYIQQQQYIQYVGDLLYVVIYLLLLLLLLPANKHNNSSLRRQISSTGNDCSGCHWIQRCSGCAIPDPHDRKAAVVLMDGVTIAIDWHLAVYEELLDVKALSEVRRHGEGDEKDKDGGRPPLTPSPSVSLHRCIDKFTEEEALTDGVCPKCKVGGWVFYMCDYPNP